MNRLPHIIILLSAILLVAAKPSQIQTWVKQLGDDNFKVREEATRKLIEAGGVAFGAVSEATNSKDVEVKQRALKIIKHFEKEAKVSLVQGVEWGKKREYDKAIAEFDKAILWNPKLVMAHYNLALARKRKSQLEKGVKELEALNKELFKIGESTEVISALESKSRSTTYIALWMLGKKDYKTPEIDYKKPYSEAEPELKKLIQFIQELSEEELVKLDKSMIYHSLIFSPIWVPGSEPEGWKY